MKTQLNNEYSLVGEDSNCCQSELDKDIEINIWKYRMCMFCCGLINNTGYVVVGTAAQNIADHFDMKSFMSAFNFSLIFLSIGMVILNASLFLKIRHQTRIYVRLTLSIVGFAIIGLCTTVDQKWAFYVALLGSTLCGCMQSFGETTMLGYCKNFSPKLIGLWCSGTGCAGIFGSGLYIALSGIGFPDIVVFGVLVPLLLIYFFSFKWLEAKRILFVPNTTAIQVTDSEASGVDTDNKDESTDNKDMNWVNIKFVASLAWQYSLNLGLVYYFEYVCLTSWADRANQANKEGNFLEQHGFAILSFSYQIGVFISRSSLEFIKIKHVSILTITQAVNCLIFCLIAVGIYYDLFQTSIYLQITLMIFVGLMGGGSYVNINYLIVSEQTIPQNCKELCMNMNSITNNFGIMLATITAMIVSNAWMVY